MLLRKLLAAALLALPLIGTTLGGTPTASAMPMVDPAPATLARDAAPTGVESVRWVCGPYGCVGRHRPRWGYAPYRHRWSHRPYRHRYGFYGHRPPGYGWRHHRYGYGSRFYGGSHHRGWHHRRYGW